MCLAPMKSLMLHSICLSSLITYVSKISLLLCSSFYIYFPHSVTLAFNFLSVIIYIEYAKTISTIMMLLNIISVKIPVGIIRFY